MVLLLLNLLHITTQKFNNLKNTKFCFQGSGVVKQKK